MSADRCPVCGKEVSGKEIGRWCQDVRYRCIGCGHYWTRDDFDRAAATRAAAIAEALKPVEAERDEAVKLLRESEWLYSPEDESFDDPERFYCPECGEPRTKGEHLPNCKLGKFLARRQP